MRAELEHVVKLLFQRVSIERIVTDQKNKKVYYDQVDPGYLQDLMLTYSHEFSDTERRLQITEIIKQTDQNKAQLFDTRGPGKLHVFSTLFFYISEILTFHENQVACKYNYLLEWNDLIHTIGEDLPVVSMLVMRDAEQGRTCQDFAWPPVIGHNNSQLNKILKRGMADNHFHLRGSSPYFYIAWINLMNHPGRKGFLEPLNVIEQNYRDKNKKSEVRIKRQPLYILVAEAALIRLYLCDRLNQQLTYLGAGFAGQEEIRTLLANPYRLEISMDALQAAIDVLLIHNNQDYMQQFASGRYVKENEEYRILSGERWFIYSMLKAMLTENRRFSREEYNWFYAYLRIKTEILSELIQVNNLTGFENFQIYQERKDWFTHVGSLPEAEGRLARLAVRGVLDEPAVRHLEVRISPGWTALENMVNIREYDRAVIKSLHPRTEFDTEIRNLVHPIVQRLQEKKTNSDDLRNHFSYVFHFTKRKDQETFFQETLECRHYQYRKEIRRKAEEILRFRKEYPQYGRRVVGIDACAQEIGCRPEVFGRVFRTLKNYSYSYEQIEDFVLPQLKITYHVGEDYLDIVDGLRAIDEAVRFLGMDCGDRLGHALALGVNADDWYYFKNNQITLPLQDYLDNIVWMHHALNKYTIDSCEALKGWLEEQYSHYFTYIYQGYLAAITKGQGRGDATPNKFDLNVYFMAWLLRGDQPRLYKTGAFREKEKGVDQWGLYAVNKHYIRSDDIRYIPEVALLYHMYHYSRGARKRGSEIKTFSIPDNYIAGVKKIQKAMMEDIADRGLAIETNPSSNIRIGSYLSFGQHPIKTFYNLGLTKNEQELMECPQLNVSINTDDKGVFATKLENEYALLAYAMEHEISADGRKRYKKEFIYEWLDNIREMGIRQIFD